MEHTEEANKVIKQHVILAMEAGLIPVPLADMVAVGGIQMDLIKRLCAIYGIEYNINQSKAVIVSLTASGLSRLGARMAAKAIPVIGSIVGGVVMSGLSGASTYAIGETFRTHFEKGGTLLDINLDEIKRFYEEKLRKGQSIVEQFKPKKKDANDSFSSSYTNNSTEKDVVTQLRELKNLKDEGVITEDEFLTLKKKIIG